MCLATPRKTSVYTTYTPYLMSGQLPSFAGSTQHTLRPMTTTELRKTSAYTTTLGLYLISGQLPSFPGSRQHTYKAPYHD